MVRVELVEGELILDPEEDEDATGHAHGQAGNIDERKQLVFL
jgi:hypothetical protein